MTEEDLDHTPLDFGKHRGQTPDALSQKHPRYVIWLYDNVVPSPVSRVLYEACVEDLNEGEDGDFSPHF